MPIFAAAAIPLWAAGATAAGTIYGAKRAGSSHDLATRTQDSANQRAIELEREREAEARRQWEAAQALQRERDAESRRQWEAEQNFLAQQWAAQEEQRLWERQQAEYQAQLLREREARLAPYRAASRSALNTLGSRLGLSIPSSSGVSSAISPSSLGSAVGLTPRASTGLTSAAPMSPVPMAMTPATEAAYTPATGQAPTLGALLAMDRERRSRSPFRQTPVWGYR